MTTVPYIFIDATTEQSNESPVRYFWSFEKDMYVNDNSYEAIIDIDGGLTAQESDVVLAKAHIKLDETRVRKALHNLVEAATADFKSWADPQDGLYNDEDIEDFKKQFTFNFGKKYIKVIREGSAWGFIVNVKDDKFFTYGDILKPKSWASPARNAPRGNVFGDYNVKWTGPHYLK